eukprot:jgi/Botrbrau1/10827/Bobra.0025s0006.1
MYFMKYSVLLILIWPLAGPSYSCTPARHSSSCNLPKLCQKVGRCHQCLAWFSSKFVLGRKTAGALPRDFAISRLDVSDLAHAFRSYKPFPFPRKPL